jgi:phosphatidylinositol glycan class V
LHEKNFLERLFSHEGILMPPYYQHIQEKYWDVGLFSYWQLRKIPLFVIAAPTIGFIFYGMMDLLFDMAFDARKYSFMG